MKPSILYIFGGEKAQGAEIVLERLMNENFVHVDAHLFISPGKFASDLIAANKPYKIILLDNLKKLNRSENGRIAYLWRAIKNYFAISYQVHRYIRANNIHIVHANTIVPSSYLLPLIIYSKVCQTSTTWLWSDHDISYYTKFEIYLSKLCAGLYHHTLVVSNAVRLKYAGNSRVVVLYNGLDCSVFVPDEDARDVFRSNYKLTPETIVFGMPGVVHPRKGQLELINAFHELNIRYPGIQLIFAGGFETSTPEYTAAVKDAIQVNNQVRHIGYADKIIDFYNGCDVILNNSNLTGSEPLGTTIYEAMACEKVVIASATGGTPEIISDNIDGFLFEPENQQELMDKFAYVIEHIFALDSLRKAARKKVETKFSIKEMTAHYNQIVFENPALTTK